MLTADSVFTLSADSLLKVDSLAQQSALPLAAPKELFLGFDGVATQSFAFADTWLFGVVLFLFFLLGLSVWLNPSIFLDNLKSVGGIKKQYFGSLKLRLATSPLFLLLYLLLSSGLIALFISLFLFKDTGQIDFFAYLSFFAMTFVFLTLKIFVARFLCYLFFERKTFVVVVKMAYNLLLLLSFMLFPLLVLAIYSSFFDLFFLFVSAVIVFVLLTLILLIRLFQLFYRKKLDFFYILLYLCSLEILPILGLFRVYELIA